jgi:hypothetical protein
VETKKENLIFGIFGMVVKDNKKPVPLEGYGVTRSNPSEVYGLI